MFRDLANSVSGDPDPETAHRLSELYTGLFASDFLYEDWAIPIRDTLHARYVEVVERAVRSDMQACHYDRALTARATDA